MLDTPLNQSDERIIVELDRLEHRPCDKIRHLQAVAVEGIDVPDTNRWGGSSQRGQSRQPLSGSNRIRSSPSPCGAFDPSRCPCALTAAALKPQMRHARTYRAEAPLSLT